MTMAAQHDVHAPPVRLRVAVADDAAFLRQLYLDARPELQLLPPSILDLQISAQRSQYLAEHPEAVDEIVELDGAPVGRCWTADAPDALHLLDLAVQAEYRRRGIGAAVLDVIADRAARRGVPVRLHVWSTNHDARRLYQAAGFTELDEVGGRIAMQLLPPSNPSIDIGSGP